MLFVPLHTIDFPSICFWLGQIAAEMMPMLDQMALYSLPAQLNEMPSLNTFFYRYHDRRCSRCQLLIVDGPIGLKQFSV